ncbi:hypothetical protein [Klebsiella phage 05F01]|nr:hypothetical protein [Klebsiella phage 05F01]
MNIVKNKLTFCNGCGTIQPLKRETKQSNEV